MSTPRGSRSSGSRSHVSEVKVVVLGDRGVGKTSLVLRFIEGFFSQVQQSTVGAFFLTKKIVLADGKTTLKMQLWDTAGQERYRAMAPMYYRGAQAAIVCFDPTNEESFNKCRDWVDELRGNVKDDANMVLAICANKLDLPEAERTVSRARAGEFADSVGALFFESSAKTDTGVKTLFQDVSQAIWDKNPDRELVSKTGSPIVVGVEATPSAKGKAGCC